MSSDIRHRIVRLSGLIILAFLLLIGWQSYWHLVKSDWLLAQPTNRRMFRAERTTARGVIFDRRDVKLAWSQDGKRRYADATATAAVLGFLHPVHGRAGVEGVWDAELSGLSQRFTAAELRRIMAGERPLGKDLVLTLDLRLQQAALRALAGKTGAVVMLDPATGGILALASTPTFDASQIDADYPALKQRTDGVLTNRATQGLYPPGSTMKVVTAAAALMHDVSPGQRYTCQGRTPLQGTTINDYHGAVHGTIAMPQALAHSCNYYFARTTVEMGQAQLYATARDFGFDERWRAKLPEQRALPVEVAKSSLAPDLSRRMYTGELAQMGFGQGTVVATPLQMAMVSAAIANDGTLMAPFLVAQVRKGGAMTTLSTFAPVTLGQPMDDKRARELAAMMRMVVTGGTASGRVNVPGVVVYGKTGTAQQTGGKDHAWFMGFAEISRGEAPQRVAFAVVIERGGGGGAVAAPVAGQVLHAWKTAHSD